VEAGDKLGVIFITLRGHELCSSCTV
jgi:hypothetical protein